MNEGDMSEEEKKAIFELFIPMNEEEQQEIFAVFKKALIFVKAINKPAIMRITYTDGNFRFETSTGEAYKAHMNDNDPLKDGDSFVAE